ncbi:MAG: hypothetical protein AAB896_00720 [Patescibacteria group bacterium]
MTIILLLAIAFIGYAIGRVSHILGGHLNAPHHWIYGVLAIIVGVIFYKHNFGRWLIAFGIGHTISDLKDMLELKFYGRDTVEVKKFWGID